MSWLRDKNRRIIKGVMMREEIIRIFNENVKGRRPDVTNANQRHDGREGHWLETQMGIAHNGDNEPDLLGYEMKNQTTSGKITFGDWSADEYIFLHGRGNKQNSINIEFNISRDDFLRIFGKPNLAKNGRLSWSGIPCPTYYNTTSEFGQKLTKDIDNNILITYNFSQDHRHNKNTIVPENMQRENLIIAKWYKESLRVKLERKFNQGGWFTCTKDSDGLYSQIHFGEPMNFDSWMKLLEEGTVFFDSGMYQGNIRPYSQWRALTGFWHSLITDTY